MNFFILFTLVLTKTFITDTCKSDNDCQSDCCGFTTGKCAGPIIALERDGGCGFGDKIPNSNAAIKLGFTGAIDNKISNSNSPSKLGFTGTNDINKVDINKVDIIDAKINSCIEFIKHNRFKKIDKKNNKSI